MKQIDYSHIIDDVITTPRNRELVRLLIPEMVRWAITGQTNKTYKDASVACGYQTFSGIGKTLGYVEDVFNQLRAETGEDFPSLNALVRNTQTKLPSDGFSYVYPSYEQMTIEEKRIFVDGINQKAVNYDHWEWVLKSLGLQPAKAFTTEDWEKLSAPAYGKGGEGEEHKKLKEYVLNHPDKFGLKNVVYAETEHVLPSGDRLDVYFELKDGTRVAIEVKSHISAIEDLSRGVFQCVKYKAILTALRSLEQDKYKIQVLLVLGAEPDPLVVKLANELGVKYMIIN